MKHLNPLCNPWSEVNLHALGCLEEIVVNKNSYYLSDEFTCLIKDIIFKILSLLPYHDNDDKFYYSKVCMNTLVSMQFKNIFCYIYASFNYVFTDRKFMLVYFALHDFRKDNLQLS